MYDNIYINTVEPLFLDIPVFVLFGIQPKKVSRDCFSSRPDFDTRLTAKHVMNAYLSKNNYRVIIRNMLLFILLRYLWNIVCYMG